jgi:PAT family beta-lactamase induction signal transducer AmpG
MHSKNLLNTRKGRFFTFGMLYISEGIPYGFTSTAMVAFMRTQGLSLEQIGTFVAALFLPWAAVALYLYSVFGDLTSR